MLCLGSQLITEIENSSAQPQTIASHEKPFLMILDLEYQMLRLVATDTDHRLERLLLRLQYMRYQNFLVEESLDSSDLHRKIQQLDIHHTIFNIVNHLFGFPSGFIFGEVPARL